MNFFTVLLLVWSQSDVSPVILNRTFIKDNLFSLSKAHKFHNVDIVVYRKENKRWTKQLTSGIKQYILMCRQ